MTSDAVIVRNNLIVGNHANRGAGVAFWRCDDVLVEGNTITENTSATGVAGNDVYNSVVLFKNNILWANLSLGGYELLVGWHVGCGQPIIEYCNVQGGIGAITTGGGCTFIWGTGNINANPLFVNPANGNYHLQQDPCQPGITNPCVDTADPSSWLPGATQTCCTGDPGFADMGYHYWPYVHDDCNLNGIPDCLELGGNDCNGNGVLDICDVLSGIETDCNLNQTPDSCDLASGILLDCNQNLIPDSCGDLPDCNGNTVPDECDIASGTSADCNGNEVPDECDIAGGTSLDCNLNGVPDECEGDCNQNGFPDDCDISAGTSLDCNSNWIPDECEEDCNDNEIPDDCDIAAGTSADLNGNGVPDECECFDPTSYCTTSPNSVGPGALIGSTGLPSVSLNQFYLTVTGAPPNQFGVFYYGAIPTNQPFGCGTRCVGGLVFRLWPPVMTDHNGEATRHLDFTAPPANGGLGLISPGDTLCFQFWYRDPGGCGWQFNLSDGLQVVFCP